MSALSKAYLKKFHITSIAVTMRARVMHGLATEHLAALQAANPLLDAAWLAALDAEIVAADAVLSPKWAITEQITATEALYKLVAPAQAAIQELYKYVALAWPGSAARLAAYGRSEYGQARRSGPRMINLVEKAAGQAAEDEAALAAVGYTPAMRTALENMKPAMEAALAAQQAAKGAVRLATEQYYQKLNDIWGRMVTINRTAQIAFHDDYGLWAPFRLYQGRKQKKKKPAASIPIEEAVEQTSGMLKNAETAG